jgi:outer membrane protein assembly factor BamB
MRKPYSVDETGGVPLSTTVPVYAVSAVADDVVYFGSGDQNFYALNAKMASGFGVTPLPATSHQESSRMARST